MAARSKEEIEEAFATSGEKDRVKQLLLDKLRSSGWTADVKRMSKEYIQEQGVENVKLENMFASLKGPARRAVPEAVKRELLELIRDFVSKETGIDDLVRRHTAYQMLLRFYLDDNGHRVYTLKKTSPEGVQTQSAHPARFSPEDKYSKYRVIVKKRFGLLASQQAKIVY